MRRAALLAALLAAACAGKNGAPAPAAASASPPPRESSASGPRVVLPSGAVIDVELARTDEERAQGLMYRASMPKEHGMVFLFDQRYAGQDASLTTLERQFRIRFSRKQNPPEFGFDAIEARLVLGFEAQHDHRRRVRRPREPESIGVLDP